MTEDILDQLTRIHARIDRIEQHLRTIESELETMYLLISPTNAAELNAAIAEVETGRVIKHDDV